MKLRQPEPLRVLDHHHRGVGHVHAHFDHGRGDQRVDLARPEPVHNCLALLAVQTPVHRGQTLAPQVAVGEPVEMGVHVLEPAVRLVDHRHDDVRLLARLEALGDIGVDVAGL